VVAVLAVAGAWLAPRFLSDDEEVGEVVPTPAAAPSPTAPRVAAAVEPPPDTPIPVREPTHAPPPVAITEPATRVLAVDWRPAGPGVVVTITADGELAAERVVASAMVVDGQPRHLVRVKAVVAGPSRLVTEVGQGGLTGIRLWLHEEIAPPELHVVLDLAPGGEVTAVEVAGTTVAITVSPGRQP
jgi:hypothetical protein